MFANTILLKNLQAETCGFFAEREGFEPPEPLSSTVFKTAAIDHSAISPGATKVEQIFNSQIVFLKKLKTRSKKNM